MRLHHHWMDVLVHFFLSPSSLVEGEGLLEPEPSLLLNLLLAVFASLLLQDSSPGQVHSNDLGNRSVLDVYIKVFAVAPQDRLLEDNLN